MTAPLSPVPPGVSPAAPIPPVSVSDAVSDAIEYTRRRLFPFQFRRWLVLGVLAFLDQCGRSVPGGSFVDRERYPFEPSQVTAWIASHVGLVMTLAALGLALGVALTALVLWINTRAMFMYLDAVVSGRAEIARPWREHAGAADGLFVWRFALTLGMMALVLVFLGAAALVAFSSPGQEPPLAGVIGLALALVFVLLPLAVAAALVGMGLRDFVAPLQLHLRADCGTAARVAWMLVRARPGVFVVYALLKIVFGLVAVAALAVTCACTCCLGIVPVLSQTLLQPLWFFERAWSVCLLRRLGYDLFASFPQPAPTPAAGTATPGLATGIA